jgi:acyl carrier protein
MDKIELFNRLARLARPAFAEYKPIETLEIPFEETGLDSMDALSFAIYMDDIYGVAQATSQDWVFATPKDMFDQYEAHATKHPTTIEEALENIE